MSKPPTTDPRIAPKEMIITRNKSAQQRRQLREKDRSMTKITQLLKPQSPKTYKNTKKKSPKTPEKKRCSAEMVDKEPNDTDRGSGLYKEYYPDKLRRKFEEKRVFLKPKYQSKTVVKLNKRKLETPQRGTILEGSTPQSEDPNSWSYVYDNKSHVFDQLSMEEVVRIVEETESLDDEDLMEILTCPSPVWWEDPPDEKYIEEPIFRRSSVNIQKPPVKTSNKSSEKQTRKTRVKNNNKKSKKADKSVNASDFITITKTDDDFLKKRSKLENLLGNIKSKGASEPNSKVNKYLNSEITKEVLDKSADLEKVSDKKVKRYSESNDSLSDLSYNNEDMLKHLENMDIPIEINSKVDCTENQAALDDAKVSNVKEELRRENDYVSHTDKANGPPIEKQNQDNESVVPPNLPRLTKRPKLQESPSVKSISDETVLSTSSGQENMDTISDTNIRFISDDDIEIVGGDSFPQVKEIKSESFGDKMDEGMEIVDNNDSPQTKEVENETIVNKEVLKALNEKKEFITVYKIVSGETIGSRFKNIPEYSNYVENLTIEENANEESKCNGQLNNFFKKCKFANRKKRKDLEAKEVEAKKLEGKESEARKLEAKASFCDTCEPKKCITVAQEENVKYCLNCSSIFDTDECSYCSVKSKSCDSDSGDIGSET